MLVRFLALSLAALPAVSTSAPAQTLQTVPQPTPDADALADAVRAIGANPRDLTALITAGELSLKLGDATAAAALFKRADEIDPMNGRVKAGMARILVSQERPGEALRFFDQAAGYGLDPRSFAGDRGLAYDLIGEQERAQRDYRVALKDNVQDEVQRRYALSLGISGKRDAALEQIDALLRRSDRGAWRARAFILAMTGDVPGAEKIAGSMMPPGMAAGLQPFFGRLAAMPAIDRAFAVHFGEIRPTSQRLADRQFAPALPALVPEPQAAPVQLAKAEPEAKRDRRRDRTASRDRRREKADRAVAIAAPVTPAAPALPQPPGYAGSGVTFAPAREVAQAVPKVAGEATAATVRRAPATVAAVPTAAVVQPVSPAVAATEPRPVPAPIAPREVPATPPPSSTIVATSPAAAPTPGFSSFAPDPVTPVASAASTATPAGPPAIVSPSPAQSVSTPTPAPAAAPVVARVAATAPSQPTPPQMSEDTILARIMAGISIPASELGVAPVRPAPEPRAASPGLSVATAESIAAAEAAKRAADAEHAARAERAAAAEQRAASRQPTEITTTEVAAKPDAKRQRADARPLPDPKLAAKKVLADKKAAADKKVADAKKLADANKLAEEKKAAKADPARIWVQVAGGAEEGDLPKAWAAVRAKSSALQGKAGYTTPLRATNRVVTGPFKTDAEARAFVNTLAKQGVSAFTFTSDKGQKMNKLGGK